MAGKARIRKNVWDNWYGYIGTRRVIAFSNSMQGVHDQEEQAKQWLAEQEPCKCLGTGEPKWHSRECPRYIKWKELQIGHAN